MPAAASLWVKLGLSDSDFIKGLKKAENDLKRFGDRLGNIGSRLTVGLSLPLALASGACVKLGMDAVESENLFTVSMGKMADAARGWSQDLRKNLGLNEYELRRNVGLYQTMSTAMGLAEGAAFNLSKGVTELGYDMASFFNVSNDQALTDLKAIWTGEAEPLKKYGIVLLETNVKQWALNNGLIRQGQEMTAAQKVVARYNLVLEQTKNAQGDLARTIDSPANKLRILQEQLKMAATEMGVALMPTVTGLMKAFTPLVQKLAAAAQWFSNLPAPIQNTIGVLLGLSIAIGPVMLGIGKMISGWSALIGMLRLLPTLKIGVLFSDIGIYIGGAIKGAWSFKAALGALSTSFAPYLIGGTIIAGIIALGVAFSNMSRAAKAMTKDISQMNDLSEIQKDISALEISRRDEVEQLNRAQKALIYVGDRQKDIVRHSQKVLDIETKIKELREKQGQITSGQNGINLSNTYTSGGDYGAGKNGETGVLKNTISSVQDSLRAALQNITTKEGLNLPGFDALKEKADAFSRALDQAINATDANTTQGQTVINAMADSLKNYQNELDTQKNANDAYNNWRSKYDAEVAAWVADDLASIGEVADPIYQFSDYLNQTSTIFSNMTGPLKEFADGVVTATSQISSIQQNVNGLQNINNSGPLGKFGGFLGAAGNISGIIGAAMSLWGIVTGSAAQQEKAAKRQQEAAERWQKFLQTASVSDLFGKLQQLEDLTKKHKSQWEKIAQLQAEIKNILGINIDNLGSALQNAFDAANPDEFLTKFDQSFNEIMRNAMIKAFVSEQALGPLSDAIAAAFDPLSQGGTTVTAQELENLKKLWESIGLEGQGFFGILDQLGLGMQDLTGETEKATASMRNVPTGFKYALNAFNVAAVETPRTSISTARTGFGLTPTDRGGMIPGITIDLKGATIFGVEDLDRKIQSSVNMALGKSTAMQGAI